MNDLKKLSKITTRYTSKEGIAHPTNQKYDFKKPTVINMDRSKIETLIKTGRIETDGLTIIYEK